MAKKKQGYQQNMLMPQKQPKGIVELSPEEVVFLQQRSHASLVPVLNQKQAQDFKDMKEPHEAVLLLYMQQSCLNIKKHLNEAARQVPQ